MQIELTTSAVHGRYMAGAKTGCAQAVIVYKMKPKVAFLKGVM